ncbi:unnamed protein product [Urochloa decumbens]|uniref:Uncharacterized protein n=1 Tax=Urochloa decumbens TaxID=240449 RepID=A0ABC9EE63_9POAL
MEARLALLVVALLAPMSAAAANVFNVKNYGSKGNGVVDDTKPLMSAWKAACAAAGAVMLVVPAGTYRIHGGVNGLTVTGGVIDGQGASSWPFNKCPIHKDCKVLPTSVLFVNNQNTVVKDLTSVNPKFFHIALLGTKNVRISGLKIDAPSTSPNTDGIHIERSAGVSKSNAARMVFENLVMKDVQNPVIIDQKYCPYYSCKHKYVSGVTIKDITFKNVKGTATTPVAVMLRCGVPCQGLVLQDVNLKYKGQGTASAKCENVEAKYVGVQLPKPCP